MLNLKHGGHMLDDESSEARAAAKSVKRMGTATLASGALPKDEPKIIGTPFDYLLPQLKDKPASRLPEQDTAKVVADLKALGAATVEQGAAPEGNSIIPAVYTYWGQFIDHDLTANTDRDPKVISDIVKPDLTPISPATITKDLKNLRRPTLDLDSLYGNGPDFVDPKSTDAGFYNGPRFRIGKNTDVPGIPGVKIPPENDLDRDLPRIGTLLKAGIITKDVLPDDLKTDPNLDTRPFIGDLRNDENLIISQFHLAFLRFHNKVVDWVEQHGQQDKAKLFNRARQLTRWHYQWLVVHDYLKTVALSRIVDKILIGGPKHYKPLDGPQGPRLFMPLEYSVAAFRFGHSMIRGGYDHNRNFGKPLDGNQPVQPFASLDDLFLFTGNGFVRDSNDATKITRNPFRGLPSLPFNWIIEWDRFTDKQDPDGSHFARKIDTRLALPLSQLVNEGNAPGLQDPDPANPDPAKKAIRDLLRFLARRNLLRGYLLSIPTGQSVAAEMGVKALSEEELRLNNSAAVNNVLEQGGFLKRTPLWFYLLKEAEVRAKGNSLGELGSRIVCETIIGLLRNSPSSFLNQQDGWDPSKGVKLDNGEPIVTIRDFLKFAGVAS